MYNVYLRIFESWTITNIWNQTVRNEKALYIENFLEILLLLKQLNKILFSWKILLNRVYIYFAITLLFHILFVQFVTPNNWTYGK